MKSIYPFAWDGGKNHFCFDYRDFANRPQIIFWNTDYMLTDDLEAAEKICDTFDELLRGSIQIVGSAINMEVLRMMKY